MIPDQKIHYIDYTFLYQWLNKTCVYPKGHPVFISQPGHTDIRRYFGIVQCRVLPPRELYHHVLPHRHGGKLTFPLCAACVEEEMTKAPLERSYLCAHSKDQRVLTGTWCTPSWRKPSSWGTRSCTSTRCGISLKSKKVSSETMSTRSSKSNKKPAGDLTGWGTTKPNVSSTSITTTRTRAFHWITTRSSTIQVCEPWPKRCSTRCGASSDSARTKRKSKNSMTRKNFTISSTRTPSMCGTSLWSMTTSWKCTISFRKKTSRCHPTSMFSWPVSPPVGRVSVSTKLLNSWVNACCILT